MRLGTVFDVPGRADFFLADCPGRLAVELIADKWTVVVISGLSAGPLRHGELADLIGGVSRKMLTQTLRRLEARGLVVRADHGGVPRHVEYALTDLGATLVEPIHVLTEWARAHGAALLEVCGEPERETGGASAASVALTG